jgi:hypothetical protein
VTISGLFVAHIHAFSSVSTELLHAASVIAVVII